MPPPRRDGDVTEVGDLVDRALTLKPAPMPLLHVQSLLNSRNLLAGYDLLSDRATAAKWLAAGNGTVFGVRRLDDADLLRLRGFREALRGPLAAHATGHEPGRETLRKLRATGAASRLTVHFDDSGDPHLEAPADSRGVQRIFDTVLAAWASAAPDQLHRLKACVNPECGWVFYDTSRSRNGTWCVMNVCGARHKMERYRGRQRQDSRDDP